MKKYFLSAITIGLTSTMILNGCSSVNQASASTGNVSTMTNPLFNTNLILPNGQAVTPNHPVHWKDLSVNLLITSLPPLYAGSNSYEAILGNHSEVLSHSNVATSAGTAKLVLNDRTPPAAAKSTTSTYEYWVIVYRSKYAYCIVATVIGNRDRAKNEVRALLNHWTVPGKERTD